MKNHILILMLLLILCITIAGCHTQPTMPTETDEPTETLTGADPSEGLSESGGMGGTDGMMSECKYDFGYYGAESRFAELVNEKDFYDWMDEVYGNNFDNAEDYTILSFIHYFNIPKEDFVAANERYEVSTVFTDEQINALYSNDNGLLADAFMNPNAVRVGDEIYPPKWVATHTLDELKAAGITESLLEAKCSEWKETFGESSDVYTGAKALLDQYQAEIESTE